MIKYFNYLFFVLLLIITFTLETNKKISTNLYAMLPDSEQKELVESFLKFDLQKKIFLAVKGDDKKSLEILRDIEKEIVKIEGIELQNLTQNSKLLEYQKKYKMYFDTLNTEKIKTLNVQNALIQTYQSLFDGFISVNIDPNDPLKLFQNKQQNISTKNGKLLLGEYGYVSIFTLSNKKNSLQNYEKIYDEIKIIENRYKDIITFSSFYYFVENSRYIKNDSSHIIMGAGILLLLLYVGFLRNINLLFNTLITLGSSALLATIILTFIYDEISLFVLVFGISVSTIAIDYMFHHYFHKNYEQKLGFNREVLLGFLTTFGAFFILSFVDFLLIKQITQFAMISLLCSYMIFAFIYTKITFKQNEFSLFRTYTVFNSKYLLGFSLLVILYSLQNLSFDFNVLSLNYDNKSLQTKELFFKDNLIDKKRQAVLIKANTIDKLIISNETLHTIDNDSKSSLDSLIGQEKFVRKEKEIESFDFEKIREDIQRFTTLSGFKKDAFTDAYRYNLVMPHFTDEKLKEFGIGIKKYKNEYIAVVYVSASKLDEISALDFVYSVSLKKIFEKNLEKDLEKMILFGLFSLGFILIVIMSIAKKKMLYALSFILVPSACILFYLSFIEINILHIFMFFIITAISVDYAIYFTKDNSQSSKKAILFSALSSFAGFGVLVFSSTPSLYSIGSVATLGLVAILILILFTKGNNGSQNIK